MIIDEIANISSQYSCLQERNRTMTIIDDMSNINATVFSSGRHQHPASGRGARVSAFAGLINQLQSYRFDLNIAWQNVDTAIVGGWGWGDTTPCAILECVKRKKRRKKSI